MCLTKIDLSNYVVSEYNENTEAYLAYYIDEMQCFIGAAAYLWDAEYQELYNLTIVHYIRRSDNAEVYDELIRNDDVLIDGEQVYHADTSAEFITDNDCYLVWFVKKERQTQQ